MRRGSQTEMNIFYIANFKQIGGIRYVEGMNNDSEGPGKKWLEMKVLK